MYCCQVKPKEDFIPLSSQPSDDRVLFIRRNFNKSKADHSYQRLISCIENDLFHKNIVVEYLGLFLGLRPYSNAALGSNRGDYIRTPSSVLKPYLMH